MNDDIKSRLKIALSGTADTYAGMWWVLATDALIALTARDDEIKKLEHDLAEADHLDDMVDDERSAERAQWRFEHDALRAENADLRKQLQDEQWSKE